MRHSMIGHEPVRPWPAAAAMRRAAVLLAVLPLTACIYGPRASLSWGEALASAFAFFIIFAAAWIFIGLFTDIWFRRDDLSGLAKAGWTLVLVVLPLLGSLIYIIARPKIAIVGEFKLEAHNQMSDSEMVAQLNELKAAGKISDADYEEEMRNVRP